MVTPIAAEPPLIASTCHRSKSKPPPLLVLQDELDSSDDIRSDTHSSGSLFPVQSINDHSESLPYLGSIYVYSTSFTFVEAQKKQQPYYGANVHSAEAKN